VLRGDLETILAKALKTDPAERYESVAEFADDLRRFLQHQPIGARPDTLGYRSAKFVQRHRRVLAGVAAASVLVVGLVAFYTLRLSMERDRATLQADKAARVSELLTGLLTGADPYRTPDAKEPTVQNLLDIGADRVSTELAHEPELQAGMLTVIGRTYNRMGLRAKALPLLEQAVAIGRRTLGPEHVTMAQSLNDLGVLHREQGNRPEAERLLSESLALRRRLLGPDHKDLAVTLVELGRVWEDGGRSAEAESVFREALAIRRKVFGDEHRETATSKSDLGLLLLGRGDLAGAEPLLRENVVTSQRLLGADHPNTATAKANLGLVLLAGDDFAQAEVTYREVLAAHGRSVGAKRPEYAQTLNNLAAAVELQGRLDEAQALFEECLGIARPQLGDEHLRVVNYAVNLARVRIARNDAAATESSLRHALKVREQALAAGDWRIAQVQSLLAASLLAQGRYTEAEPLMLAADRALAPIGGAQRRERTANRARLVRLFTSSGRPTLADAYR
jgi:tetratricopeptide (TPR) repeat protein